MSAMSVEVPFPVFYDRAGEPLENGYVWIGQANLNPQTNPIQVYFDRNLTQPAAQPLRTLAGYISNAGTPAQIYVNAVNFSILVQDKNGTMVYNFPDGTGISPSASGVGFIGFKGQVGNLQDIADDDGADWIGFDPQGTGAVARSVQDKLREIISVKDFGAVGDGVADDYDAIQAANDAAASLGVSVYFPGGVYGINLASHSNVSLSQTASWFANNDATILRLDFGTTVAAFMMEQNNQTGLLLRGLTFDGQVTTSSTPTVPNNDPPIGTYVAAGDSVSEAFWSKSYGVVLRGAQDTIVENCTFKNFLRAGLRVDNQFTATRRTFNIKISNCHVQRTRGYFGDSFYFGGVENVGVSNCTAYDYQRIAYVLEFGDVTYNSIPGHVRYENCYAELGHDGIIPESNFGWWTECGQDIVHSNCQVYSSGAGFLYSGNFIQTGQSFTSYGSYVNCSAIKVFKFGRFIGGFTHSTAVDIDNCFGQIVAPGSSLAPVGSPIVVGYGNVFWLQADTSVATSHTITYNITNCKMEMIDFGPLSPANTEFGVIQVANTDPVGAGTAKQFQVNISELQTQWLTAAGAIDTSAVTVFETCTSGKFGDIVVKGLNDFGNPTDARTALQMNISNSANMSFGYLMGSFEMVKDESALRINNSNISLRKPTTAASNGYLYVSNADLFDFRGDIRFESGWWIDNCTIADANPSSIDRSTVLFGLSTEALNSRKITNCEIKRQIRFAMDGGPSNTEYKLRLILANNRFYIPFETESGLYLSQGFPLFTQVMLTNNAFMNNGTGSMSATASMIECAQANTSQILFTGAGNAFDNAMVAGGGHVVQVNTTPTYNDAPQTVAAPFNTVFGARVQFYPI
jgi:hypothetical protein